MMATRKYEKGEPSTKLPAVIELNIGGQHYTTLLQTLTKEPDSMLADMFSGRHQLTKDDSGRYFIDADGDIFSHILNFLRVGQLPPQEVSSEVSRYAEYFGIQSLVKKLEQVSWTNTNKEQQVSWNSTASKGRKKSSDLFPSKVQKTSAEATASNNQKQATDTLMTPPIEQGTISLKPGEENKTNLIINYLPPALTDTAFSALFMPVGPIRTLKICRDKTGRSYGFGFVDFKNPEDAQKAIRELNGKEIMNKKIKVTMVQKRDPVKGASLCVKNLPKTYAKEDLKDLFSEFGTVIHTNVLKDPAKTVDPKNVGFVVFEKETEAQKAVEKMNGKILPGVETPLFVKTADDKSKVGKSKSAGKRPNQKLSSRPGQTASSVPVPMTSTAGGEIMANIPTPMIGNRPGPMLPHGPRPLMQDLQDEMMVHGRFPIMSSIADEMMNNAPSPMMANGPGQMMGNGQCNINERMLNPNMPCNYMNNKSMEGFMRNSVADAMKNVQQNRLAQQQNPPLAHNSGLSQNSFFNPHSLGMDRPDLHKPITSLGSCLFVHNVGSECEQTDLYRLFAPYGALLKVEVIKDKDTDRCKGYAFVTYMNTEEAEVAIQMLNGTCFKGRQLQVSFKK